MAWKLTLLCHHCGEKFSWYEENWPDECPLCHSYVGNDGKPEVAAPFIGTRAGKSPDQVYRAMERGSEHRMHLAKDAGLSTEEANTLKITDMRDNALPGETSAPKLTPQQQNILSQSATRTREDAVGRFSAAEIAHPSSGIGSGLKSLKSMQRTLRGV